MLQAFGVWCTFEAYVLGRRAVAQRSTGLWNWPDSWAMIRTCGWPSAWWR